MNARRTAAAVRSAARLPGRLRRAQLNPSEVAEAVRICVVAAMVEWSLRHEPLTRTAQRAHVRLATGDHEPAATRPILPPWARRRAQLTLAVLHRGPFDSSCLRQALVLGNRWEALEPELVVGVREHDGWVAAHAWLRIDGVDFDPEAHTYGVLDVGGDQPLTSPPASA